MQILIDVGGIFLTTFLISLFTPIFWVVLFLILMQYRRVAAMEVKLYGRPLNKIGRQMLISIGLGLPGGLLASVILLFLGLSLEQIGLYFIWPVALLLLLINPRYLCFSYAGGIVAVVVLALRHLILPLAPGLAANSIIESLLRIHIPALLVLIGLLHLVEAVLIYLGGHLGSSPLYLKQENGSVVGAFSLQRFWPLPLVALMVAVVAQSEIAGVSMPQWWPILKSTLQPGEGQSLQYMLIPVAAGLGYADLALTSTPREKSAFSAKWLALYSVVLLVVAIAAEFRPLLVIPGVLFAPLGHELLILYSNKREKKAAPRYGQAAEGVPLMLVLPDSAAAAAGLASGDLICRVNGKSVNNSTELLQAIDESYFLVLLEGQRDSDHFSVVLKKKHAETGKGDSPFSAGEQEVVAHNPLHRAVALGIIPVPAADSHVYAEIRKPDPLGRLKQLPNRVKAFFLKFKG
jgi:hypothetical protein